jgi:hypothetical protein
MPYLDITCAECGETFPFTEREQDYYRERGLSHPKRCKPCRDARRTSFGGAKQGGGGATIANGLRSFAISAASPTPFLQTTGGASDLVRRML